MSTTDIEPERAAAAHRPGWSRVAAATGAGYVLLVLVGNQIATSGGPQDAHPTGQQVLADVARRTGSAASIVGFVLEVTGFVAYLAFLAYLAALAARPGIGGSRLRGLDSVGVLGAATAVLSGLTMLAIKLGSAAPMVVLTLDRHELSPTLARVLSDLNGAAFVVSWLPFALFIFGLAVQLRRLGAIGRPTAYVGVVIGVVGLPLSIVGLYDVTGANPLAFLASLLWLLVVSTRLTLARSRPAATEPVRSRSTALAATSGVGR